MFNKLIRTFVLNKTEDKANKFVPIIFDFMTIAIISLSVNSFILNNHSSYFAQKYFGVFSVLLMSTHWYVQNIFRDKYEKNKYIFTQLNFWTVLSMGLMAVGLSLMAFRLNQKAEVQEFLKWFSIAMYLFGLILSRFVVFISYLMTYIANRRNKIERQLILYKVLSRGLEVLIVSLNLILLVVYRDTELLIYIFMPIYFIIEFIGNNLNLRKRKADAYIFTIAYVKERYRRLSILFISSIFISLITQIAYYLNSENFLKPLMYFVLEFAILYFLYNLYVRVSYGDDPEISTKNLIKMSILSPLISASLTVFGGFLINSISSYEYTISLVLIFTLALIHFLIGLIYSTHKSISKAEWEEAIVIHLITPLILIIFGVIVIYFPIDIWIILIIILGILILESIVHAFLVNHVFSNRKQSH